MAGRSLLGGLGRGGSPSFVSSWTSSAGRALQGRRCASRRLSPRGWPPCRAPRQRPPDDVARRAPQHRRRSTQERDPLPSSRAASTCTGALRPATPHFPTPTSGLHTPRRRCSARAPRPAPPLPRPKGLADPPTATARRSRRTAGHPAGAPAGDHIRASRDAPCPRRLRLSENPRTLCLHRLTLIWNMLCQGTHPTRRRAEPAPPAGHAPHGTRASSRLLVSLGSLCIGWLPHERVHRIGKDERCTRSFCSLEASAVSDVGSSLRSPGGQQTRRRQGPHVLVPIQM